MLKKTAILENLMFYSSGLLRKRNSSVDIDILNKFVFLNSSCSEELVGLKNYLGTGILSDNCFFNISRHQFSNTHINF